MKKMLILTLIGLSAGHIYSTTTAPVLTKSEINAKIAKLQDNIKLYNSFIKTFADAPDNVAAFKEDIADAQADIKKLQEQLKTAPK